MTSHPRLKNTIISRALDLFREKGYQSTSLQDISEAANTSRGGFYHHFASKEDLLYLIHETFISHELERGMAAQAMPGTATQRLRQLIVDLVESIELYRPHVTVFFEERRFLSSDKFTLVKEKRDRYEAVVKGLVAEGIRAGEFRSDLNPSLATLAIFGMCNWTYQWHRPGGDLSARQIGEFFVELVLKGIRQSTGGE